MFCQKFYQIDASTLTCEEYLTQVTGIPFKTLMSDFYTAIAAGDLYGNYSFSGDRIAAGKAATFPDFFPETVTRTIRCLQLLQSL